jgi:hypothetical protein
MKRLLGGADHSLLPKIAAHRGVHYATLVCRDGVQRESGRTFTAADVGRRAQSGCAEEIGEA